MVTTKTTTTTEVPEVAQKIREQMLRPLSSHSNCCSTLRRLDQGPLGSSRRRSAHHSWCPPLCRCRGCHQVHVRFANDLLKAQREFALQLAGVLATDKVA